MGLESLKKFQETTGGRAKQTVRALKVSKTDQSFKDQSNKPIIMMMKMIKMALHMAEV